MYTLLDMELDLSLVDESRQQLLSDFKDAITAPLSVAFEATENFTIKCLKFDSVWRVVTSKIIPEELKNELSFHLTADIFNQNLYYLVCRLKKSIGKIKRNLGIYTVTSKAPQPEKQFRISKRRLIKECNTDGTPRHYTQVQLVPTIITIRNIKTGVEETDYISILCEKHSLSRSTLSRYGRFGDWENSDKTKVVPPPIGYVKKGVRSGSNHPMSTKTTLRHKITGEEMTGTTVELFKKLELSRSMIYNYGEHKGWVRLNYEPKIKKLSKEQKSERAKARRNAGIRHPKATMIKIKNKETGEVVEGFIADLAKKYHFSRTRFYKSRESRNWIETK